MIEYKLNQDGSYAQRITDNVETGVWCDTSANAEYLAWLAEGNTPNPYVPPPEPAPLTPAEKLAAAGLSVDELKSLLGIN